MDNVAFVVESPAINSVTGERVGTLRLYVATEERAKSVAEEHPDRSYRKILVGDMPAKARENFEQSRLI